MDDRKTRVFVASAIAAIFIAIADARPLIAAQGNLLHQLVESSNSEMAKKGGSLSVALEWTDEEAKPLLESFKKDFPFIKETSFSRVRGTELMQRTFMEYKAGRTPKYDIMHVSFEAWPTYRDAGAFVRPPFSYKELMKSLPPDWTPPDPRAIDPNGYFLAIAGLARGIVYNKNIVSPDKAPKGWEDCLDPMWRGKFLYDPRPKLTALQHDPKTREAHLRWLKGIVENKVILGVAGAQTANVEKVAASEYPLFCGVNYHSAIRQIDDGAPLNFIFPDPFPLEFGTQIHILKWSKTPATTQLFILWSAIKGQSMVEKYSYRGFPWDTHSRKYLLAKGKYIAVCDVECLKKSEEYDAEHAKILGLPGAK
ncbi:MAG: extracellular solute-binding protein [Deltaproteobacteria bacterium]|nr:extracellular solute-binding protein [Deltaproteobacteria bacterium]